MKNALAAARAFFSPFYWTENLIYSPQISNKGVFSMRGYVVAARGHYEIYTRDGRLLSTADTKAEAMEDLKEWEEELIA